MWYCEYCGCQGIAGGLDFCPMCFRPRTENVPAGSSVSDASSMAAPPTAVVNREILQAPTVTEDVAEGDWGTTDAKNN